MREWVGDHRTSEVFEPRGTEGGDEGSGMDMDTASRSGTHTTSSTGLGRS